MIWYIYLLNQYFIYTELLYFKIKLSIFTEFFVTQYKCSVIECAMSYSLYYQLAPLFLFTKISRELLTLFFASIIFCYRLYEIYRIK